MNQTEGTAEAEPTVVPWELPRHALGVRFIRTLSDAFRPVQSAPSFLNAHARRPAWTFFLLTWIPLALIEGVIPFTRTLAFERGWVIQPLDHTSLQVHLADIAASMGLSLLVAGVSLMALAVPYIQLVQGYGEEQARRTALVFLSYRCWLLPAHGLLLYLAAWSVPNTWGVQFQLAAELFALIPLLLLFAAMQAVTRVAGGRSIVASLATVLVPFTLVLIVRRLLLPLLPFLPQE